MTTTISSMTGFTSLQSTLNHAPMCLELRSLNHRYLDIRLYLPQELRSLDFQLRKLLQKSFYRGSIELRLSFLPGTDPTTYHIHQNQWLQYLKDLKKIQKKHASSFPKSLSWELLSLPHLVYEKNPLRFLSPSLLWKRTKPFFTKAIQQLKQSRLQEGAYLFQKLKKLTHSLRTQITTLKKLHKKNTPIFFKKIEKKWNTFTASHPSSRPHSSSRPELALLKEKADIQEELDRLQGHFKSFRSSLFQNTSPLGRKLEFLLQEMHREITTLSTKCQILSLQQKALEIKLTIDQIREQVLNIE